MLEIIKRMHSMLYLSEWISTYNKVVKSFVQNLSVLHGTPWPNAELTHGQNATSSPSFQLIILKRIECYESLVSN